MGLIDRFFTKALPAHVAAADQAVIIELDGASLPDAVYEQHDIVTLEDLLQDALGLLGVCDGSEYGAESTRIYLYGADAESMFQAIEHVLLDYPLAAGSLVTVREGAHGAPQREMRFTRRSRNFRTGTVGDTRSDREFGLLPREAAVVDGALSR